VAQESPLEGYGAYVTYVPLRTEASFKEFLKLPDVPVYEIAPRAALNPFAEAEKAAALVAGKKTVVLLPGRKFDASGTRFGQGGGWYDRFLSAVPTEWTRVGFCFTRQFSPETLKREEWDQVMDFVCVIDEKTGMKTVHTTGARPLVHFPA
jgi:5-formyltetrahydrofolate cyclo-ligase